MQAQSLTLVTIIVESILQEQLCQLALELGSTGYTVSACNGSGSQGTRSGLMDVDMNVKIEILANQTVADSITSEVKRRFATNYGLILFTQPVTALANRQI